MPWHNDPVRLLLYRMNNLHVGEYGHVPDELGGGVVTREPHRFVYVGPRRTFTVRCSRPGRILPAMHKLIQNLQETQKCTASSAS